MSDLNSRVALGALPKAIREHHILRDNQCKALVSEVENAIHGSTAGIMPEWLARRAALAATEIVFATKTTAVTVHDLRAYRHQIESAREQVRLATNALRNLAE